MPTFPRFRKANAANRLFVRALKDATVHAHYVVLRVVIQNHTRGHLLRISNLRVIKAQIERIGFRIDSQLHNFPFMLLIKVNSHDL